MFSHSSDINPCHSLFFDPDHLRSNMGDHFRPGIICGSIWGSFAVRDHLRSWDHLRTRTVPLAPAFGCTIVVFLSLMNKFTILRSLKINEKKVLLFCTSHYPSIRIKTLGLAWLAAVIRAKKISRYKDPLFQ